MFGIFWGVGEKGLAPFLEGAGGDTGAEGGVSCGAGDYGSWACVLENVLFVCCCCENGVGAEVFGCADGLVDFEDHGGHC